MAARSKLKWLCKTPTSTAFAALFAIGQCMAQNPAGAPAQSGPEAPKKPEIVAAFSGQQTSSFIASAESFWQDPSRP
jgi:hypothetical protein